MADFEDANTPPWDNMVGGQLNLGRDRPHDRLHEPRGQGLRCRPDEELATIVVRPRGWHLPEKHVLVDGQPISGSLVDFGLYFFHCARRLLDQGKGPYFYLPKMESHLEARLWNDAFQLAQDRARHPAGHDQGDGADRDHPGRLRDGRDPLRAARPLRRAQRRPLGLHVLASSRSSGPGPRLHAARPQHGHDDRAVHARLHRAAGQDLPPPGRVRHGRHGGLHPQPRATRDQRAGRGQGPRGQEARGRRRLRRLLGGPPRPGPGVPEVFDGVLGDRPNQIGRQRDDVQVDRPSCSTSPRPPATSTEEGLRNNVNVGIQYICLLAARPGRVAHLQPDGGRGHRRDLPLPGLAVGAQRRQAGRGPDGHRRPGPPDRSPRSWRRSASRSETSSSTQAGSTQSGALFEQVALADEFVEFLTIPAYEQLD